MKPPTLALIVAFVGAAVAASLIAVPRWNEPTAAKRPETRTMSPSIVSRAPADSPGRTASTAPSASARSPASVTVDEAIKELRLIRPASEKMAHDFTLKTMDGTRFRLADQRGKVVLVNFWATWCPPCREEMPAMERLYRRQKDHGFVMVAVSLDGDPAVVPPFVKAHKLSFPIALDPNLDAANAYGVRALPSSFVIDKRGVMTALAFGSRPWDNRAAQALVEGLGR